MNLLCARFGASFEQVAHRLTTMQRVGARGLPFFMIRIDRAGQSSKRYAGASGAALAETDGRCPIWAVHNAFDAGGRIVTQLAQLEDDSRWFTIAKTVRPQNGEAEFAIALGLDASMAVALAATRGIDLKSGAAAQIGLGCANCTRPQCPQRSAPPLGRVLSFNEYQRGLTAFEFVGD